MVEGTRHVKRSATVTEMFDAVTPRMLAASASGPSGSNGNSGVLVQVGMLQVEALAETTDNSAVVAKARETAGADSFAGKPSSSAVTVVGSMKTRQKEVGFQVLVGSAQKLHPSLEAGAAGAILAFADAAPTACYEIYAAWKEGDAELARLKQERIIEAAQSVAGDLGIPGIKYAMDLNGYYGGPSRLPFLPLIAETKAEIERVLADVRN
jgi:hypothetical protein